MESEKPKKNNPEVNQIARTFTLVGLIVVVLLALHFLPKLSVGETELRRVNLLSDVLPEVESDGLDFMPEVPEVPKAPLTPPEGGTMVATAQASQAPQAPLSAPKGATKAPSADSITIEAPSGAVGGASSSGTAGGVSSSGAAEGASTSFILDYSQGGAGGMHHFYQALANAKKMNRPVRVAYYGDSFIEGDIFTADLRELLQDQFGGNGVGWVDCASQVHGFRTTVVHNFSGINEYEVVKRPFKVTNQGIAQRYFTAANGAKINYKGSKVRHHLNAWDKAIFYLRTDGGLTMRTTINGDTTLVNTVEGSQNLQIVEHKAPQASKAAQAPPSAPEGATIDPSSDSKTIEAPSGAVGGASPSGAVGGAAASSSISSVNYSFTSIGAGTLLYGVAFEGTKGVVVDNFSMRGSAGYTLSNIPAATLAQFAARRPYDLIVLHFGLNVANAKQANYSGYTRQMGEAIDHLRQAYPEASFLIVSMPDRDQRTDAGLRTMKGVEQLVAYQQIMASDHAVSFFNLFEAMGGRESMKGLVEQGMANKDYTHINFKGGRHLARLLYDALMAGYHSYYD